MQPSQNPVGGSFPPETQTDLQEMVNGVSVVRWNPVRPDFQTGVVAPVDNFGDLLGPEIVSALSAGLPAPSARPETRLLAVGSIMHYARDGDVVWGSGVNGKIPLSKLTAQNLDIRAVRGPRTRSILRDLGHSVPAVYGDPALLLPRLFPEFAVLSCVKTRSITIVPNFNDLSDELLADERVLSPRGDLWDIVRTIAQSEFVIGSSLHAIVIAEAFGIPARLVRSATETHHKSVDYYAGTGRSRIIIADDIDEAIGLGGAVQGDPDLDGLLDSFPSDLWTGYPPLASTPARSSSSDDHLSFAQNARETVALAWEAREYSGATDTELASRFVERMISPVLTSASRLDAANFDGAVDAAAEYIGLLSPEALATIQPIGREWVDRDYSVIRRTVMLHERGTVSEVTALDVVDRGVRIEGLFFNDEPHAVVDSFTASFVDGSRRAVAAPAAELTPLTEDGSVWGWSIVLEPAFLESLVGHEWNLAVGLSPSVGVGFRVVRCRFGLSAELETPDDSTALAFRRNSSGNLAIGTPLAAVVPV
jgi:pyruvyltransferase